MSPKRNPKFKCALYLLIPTLSFEGRDTHMVPENLHQTHFLSTVYHLTWVNWIKHKKNPNDVYKQRERDRLGHIFFKKNLKKIKNDHPPQKKFKKIKKMPCYQGTGLGCPVALLTGFPSNPHIVCTTPTVQYGTLETFQLFSILGCIRNSSENCLFIMNR